MAERTRRDRTGSCARRGRSGQRFLHRCSRDRVQGYAIRASRRRHEAGLRRGDRSAYQTILAALVRAEQCGARDRRQRGSAEDAGRSPRALREHPAQNDPRARGGSLPAAQPHDHPAHDDARLSARGRRLPSARSRRFRFSRLVRSAGRARQQPRRAPRARRRRTRARRRVAVDALREGSAARVRGRGAVAGQRSRHDGEEARKHPHELS